MTKVKQETISINKDSELAKKFRDYCEQRNLSRPEALGQLMKDVQRTIDIETFMNRFENVLSNVETMLSDLKKGEAKMQETTERIPSGMTGENCILQETSSSSIAFKDFADETNKQPISEPFDQSPRMNTLYYANGLVKQTEGSEVRYFDKGKYKGVPLMEVICKDTAYIALLLQTAANYNSKQRFTLSSAELQLYNKIKESE